MTGPLVSRQLLAEEGFLSFLVLHGALGLEWLFLKSLVLLVGKVCGDDEGGGRVLTLALFCSGPLGGAKGNMIFTAISLASLHLVSLLLKNLSLSGLLKLVAF